MTQNDTEVFLAHFGKKGMKWGVHHDSDESSGSSSTRSSKAPKPTAQDIKDARIRQQSRLNKLNDTADKLNLAKTDKGRDAATKMYIKLSDEYVNNPDHKTALKTTRGEKVVKGMWAGLLAVSIAAVAADRLH